MFACEEAEYLGLISRKGMKTDPRKIAAMKQWPSPKDFKALRNFWVSLVTIGNLLKVMVR